MMIWAEALINRRVRSRRKTLHVGVGKLRLVELRGLEPPTSSVQGRRSPKLSYSPT